MIIILNFTQLESLYHIILSLYRNPFPLAFRPLFPLLLLNLGDYFIMNNRRKNESPRDNNMKEKKNGFLIFRIVLIALWIAMMALIVWFSDQPDYVSQEQSLNVGKFLCSIIVGGYENMSADKQLEYAKMLDHFVRKSAHFCEYAVLGVLTFNAVTLFFKYIVKRINGKLEMILPKIATVLWCFVFAATDEIHQYYVPGRFSSFTDVLLDTAGAATGMLFIMVVIYIITRS